METQYSWIGIHIYHDDINDLLIHFKNFNYQYPASFFQRNNYRGNNLFVLTKTGEEAKKTTKEQLISTADSFIKNHPARERIIQLPVNDWFMPMPANTYIIKENYETDQMEVGGIQAGKIVDEILCHSSNIAVNHIDEAGTWSTNNAILTGIPTIATLLHGIKLSPEEAYIVLDSLFNDLLLISSLKTEDDINAFIKKTRNQYESQKTMFVEFIEQNMECLATREFENQEIEHWHNLLSESRISLDQLVTDRAFFAPESYSFNPELSFPQANQMLWPTYKYIIRFINNMLDIRKGLELYFVFILKESFFHISKENIINKEIY